MEYWIFLTIFTIILLIFIIKRFITNKPQITELIENKIVLKIEVPRKNDKTPLAAEQMFSSLHGIIRQSNVSDDHFSLEISSSKFGIYFLAVINQSKQKFVEGQLYAQYPDANISQVNDYANLVDVTNVNVADAELSLEKEFFLPIRTFINFEVDPLASITSAIAGMENEEQVWIQFLIRPVSNFWQKVGRNYVTTKKNAKHTTHENGVEKSVNIPLESGEQEELQQIETKSKKLGFFVKIRIISVSKDMNVAQNHLHDAISSFKQFQTGHLNSFVQKNKPFLFKDILGSGVTLTPMQKYQARYLSSKEQDILNAEELASVFHLPNFSVETPHIIWATSRRLPFSLNIPTRSNSIKDDNVRYFGTTNYHNTFVPFGIKQEDRRRHMYILGKTGTGKSTLMKNMIIADIVDGHGVCFIDPHGQDIEDILQYIPPNRIKDVIYMDPSDLGYPVALNLLELKHEEQRDLVADGVVEVFKKHFDSWGPRLQYILHNTLLTLLFAQNSTLLGVQRILTDRNYRKFILKQLKDPILYKFWEEEYEDLSSNNRLFTEAVAPIQNKIGRFLSSGIIRNIVGQTKSSIDLEDVMNNQKILLVNLSQGKIGEENSALLGGMLVTRIQTTAMQRVNIPENDRKDFFLYIDEFQNFATPAFAKILSEARKYRLCLIVAHQYIAQLSEEVKNAVFGNVGTIASFVVGPQDGSTMEKEFAPYVTQDDLISLERYHMIMKMMVNGEQSKPFSAISLKNDFTQYGLQDTIIAQSRSDYGKPRDVVEDKINKWSAGVYNSKGSLLPIAVVQAHALNSIKVKQLADLAKSNQQKNNE